MRATLPVSAGLLGTSLILSLAGPAIGHDKEPPSVTTQSAINVTTTAAHLRAQVKTGDDDARYRFEYGTSTGYGTTTPWRELDKSESSYVVTRSVSGLAPGTTYQFRVVASDDDGDNVVRGANRSFTTAAPATTPAVAPAPLVPADPAPGALHRLGAEARPQRGRRTPRRQRPGQAPRIPAERRAPGR